MFTTDPHGSVKISRYLENKSIPNFALNNMNSWPGEVAHAYNPSTLGGQGGGSRGQEIETILVNKVKPRLY